MQREGMDLGTIAIVGLALWLVAMWKLHGILVEVRILRAEQASGSRLTAEQEEAIATEPSVP